MATSFVKPWTSLTSPADPVGSFIPTLDVVFLDGDGRLMLEVFLVDSGADISMAPRQLCQDLGLDWEAGEPIQLSGISAKAECAVAARIHEVELLIPEIGLVLAVPICFADGDTSQLLGREGFFDAFRIAFDKQRLSTEFELMESLE